MEIKEYLKYYIGQKCQLIEEGEETKKFTLTAYNFNYYRDWHHLIKPELRRLSSMTEQEGIPLFGTDKYWDVVCGEGDCKSFTPASFHYLLSRGFWLFGEEAFEKGLIIDQSSLNTSK